MIFQILDVMDAPCKQVNWNRTPPPPYVPGFGFPCYSVSGDETSLQTKRDIGVTLNLVITYKNKCVHPRFSCAYRCFQFVTILILRFGENDWGIVPNNPTSADMQYTVEAK